jgi:cyclophilin family peptidyl-prolyl cis-trans isomerase
MGTAKRERQKQGRQARLEQAHAAAARRKRRRTGILLGGLVLLLVAATLVMGGLGGGDDDDDEDLETRSTATTTAGPTTTIEAYGSATECPAADGSSPRTIDFTEPPPLCIDPARSYSAVFTTSAGVVRVALDSATTPVATNNFVVLSRYHYYDDTALFRTNTEIGIIQGGSPHTQDNSDPGPGYTIVDEGFEDEVAVSGGPGPYRYTAGDLVYARPSGQPDSSSAQFFFCATDACSGLDSQGIYVRFGTTTEGLEVLQAILDAAPEGEGAPSEAVTVESVTIEEA